MSEYWFGRCNVFATRCPTDNTIDTNLDADFPDNLLMFFVQHYIISHFLLQATNQKSYKIKICSNGAIYNPALNSMRVLWVCCIVMLHFAFFLTHEFVIHLDEDDEEEKHSTKVSSNWTIFFENKHTIILFINQTFFFFLFLLSLGDAKLAMSWSRIDFFLVNMMCWARMPRPSAAHIGHTRVEFYCCCRRCVVVAVDDDPIEHP